MTAKILNIFLPFVDDVCSELLYRTHASQGSDQENSDFLKAAVARDLKHALVHKLSTPFTRDEFNAKCRLNRENVLFVGLLASAGASPDSVFLATPVKDGQPFFHFSSSGPLSWAAAKKASGAAGSMKDWLVDSTSEEGINLVKLINDDYFLAIKLTFNAKLYVSSAKLLMSAIDSLAYVAFGDVEKNPFVAFLEKYADLSSLGITPLELWEFRNGLLHMTNIDSRQVRSKKIRRISVRVCGTHSYSYDEDEETLYFDLHGLLLLFGKAVGEWLKTYNQRPETFDKFVERYDRTISDSRMHITNVAEKPPLMETEQ